MQKTLLPNNVTIREINGYETKFLYKEIFVRQLYLKHGIVIEDGAVVLDVGANIGLFALFLFTNFSPSQVYCFEPAPHCAEALRANLSPWADRTRVCDHALGDRTGEADFTYYPGYSIMSGLFADKARDLEVLRAGARTQIAQASDRPVPPQMIDLLVGTKLDRAVAFKCPIATLSDVLDAEAIARVDLLKIDVEFAEGHILKGIRDEHWPRIRQIVVEVHDQGAREHEAMRDLLAAKGYETVLSVDQGMENSAIYDLTARRL